MDEKGDNMFHAPHVYVDIEVPGFCRLGYRFLDIAGEHRDVRNMERVSAFPKQFLEAPVGRIHKDRPLSLDAGTLEDVRNFRGVSRLFDVDGRYDFMQPRDIVIVGNVQTDEPFLEVTHRHASSVGALVQIAREEFKVRHELRQQLGRDPSDDEIVNVIEVDRFPSWKIERM